MPDTDDLMPIMKGKILKAVPMDILDARQADINHGQTLRGLRSRGGLSASEALALVERRAWHSVPLAEAEDKLSRYIFMPAKKAPAQDPARDA